MREVRCTTKPHEGVFHDGLEGGFTSVLLATCLWKGVGRSSRYWQRGPAPPGPVGGELLQGELFPVQGP